MEPAAVIASPQQIELLHHTLGLSAAQRTPYRNHFVAGSDHSDFAVLEVLEAAGLLQRVNTRSFQPTRDVVFAATNEGRAVALGALPPAPKRTRYDHFLHGCCSGTFGEFLVGHLLPKVEARGERWNRSAEYRMYRLAEACPDAARDLQGEWRPTLKDAKASYKVALAARKKEKPNGNG